MGLVRKMHMKQKTAYIMKARHCCLEQNTEQKLWMPRSFLGGKVNLHTSHLFFELFMDFWRDQVEERQGEALWRWALKERGLSNITWSVCNASVVQEIPMPQTYSTSILRNLSHVPRVCQQQPTYLQSKWLRLSQPRNTKVHFHTTHTAQEKGDQVLLVSPPQDEWFE